MDKRFEGLTREDLLAAIKAMDEAEEAAAREAEVAKAKELDAARLEAITAVINYLYQAEILSEEEVKEIKVNKVIEVLKEGEDAVKNPRKFNPFGMFGMPHIRMKVNGHEPTDEDMDIIKKFVGSL